MSCPTFKLEIRTCLLTIYQLDHAGNVKYSIASIPFVQNDLKMKVNEIIESIEIISEDFNVRENITYSNTTLSTHDGSSETVLSPVNFEAFKNIIFNGWSGCLNASGSSSSTPLMLTTDTTGDGVSLSGVDNHTADITIRSTIAGNSIITESDGGVYLNTDAYELTHDATTDWTGPASGVYTITIPEATHSKGISPTVITWEDDGSGGFDEVIPQTININAAGDVVISVTDIPDSRYSGKIQIRQ